MSDSEKLSPEQKPDQEDAPEAMSAQDGDSASAETADVDVAPVAEASDDSTQPSGDQEPNEEEEEKIPFETLESTVGEGSVLKLKFQVPYEQYTDKVDDIFKRIHKETIVEGFRKGKAPMNLIRTRYRRMAGEDAILTIQRTVLGQHLEAESIEPLTDPTIETIEEVKPDEPMVFTCEFEVRPTLDHVDLDDLNVEVTRQSVDDEAVDRELEAMQSRMATYVTDDNGEVHEGCLVMMDIDAVDQEGAKVDAWTHKDLQLPYTKGKMLEPLHEALAGKRAGDVAQATGESRKDGGKAETQLTITVKEVQRMELPDLDDEFAKDVGEYETLDELKQSLRDNFQKEAEAQERSEALSACYQKLGERAKLQLPSALIGATAHNILEDDIRDLQRRGLGLSHINDQIGRMLMASSQMKAEIALQSSIIQEAVARQEDIAVTDDEVQAEIARLAEIEGRKPLALQAQLERDKRMDELRNTLQSQKVNDFVLSKATITYVEKTEGAAETAEEDSASPEKPEPSDNQ